VAAETLAYEHLDCSDPERPVVARKAFKVIHLIREHVAYGWSAEELVLNHPQLTLGEVYAALAYYADHREKLDRQLAATEEEAARMHAESRHRGVSSRLKR
jgi:uncharacterized protein (DUF433 family)